MFASSLIPVVTLTVYWLPPLRLSLRSSTIRGPKAWRDTASGVLEPCR